MYLMYDGRTMDSFVQGKKKKFFMGEFRRLVNGSMRIKGAYAK